MHDIASNSRAASSIEMTTSLRAGSVTSFVETV